MTLFLVRISVGVAIFLGLLFCGWWTYSMVAEDLPVGVAVHESQEELDLKRDALVAEWILPMVVYFIILALMVAAIADEVRRLLRYRAGRDESNHDGAQ